MKPCEDQWRILRRIFFQQRDDTTVIADGFPVLNALREVHLILAQGAHNQFGDLPWTSRVEMLMEMWLLARPEMREFLRGRIMVPYPEPWMDAVDSMKSLQKWNDTSIREFRDLGVFGEQLLLSIRYDNWSVYNDADPARHTSVAGSTQPLGIEVQQTTFAFYHPGPIANIIFVRYKLINKGGNTLDSMFVSAWSDPDLGGALDDLVGCDTTLSLGYAYNSTNNDEVYSSRPPAVGLQFLQGPVIPTGTPGVFETLGMTSFHKYIGGTGEGGHVVFSPCRSCFILSGARTRAQSKDPASSVDESSASNVSITSRQDPSTPASTPALRMTRRTAASRSKNTD